MRRKYNCTGTCACVVKGEYRHAHLLNFSSDLQTLTGWIQVTFWMID